MFTKFLLIQQIEENGDGNFHLIKSNYLQWSFENRRTKIETDSYLFPFQIDDKDLRIETRKPGPETKIIAKQNEIIFADEYAVPKGFTIGILFPENFIPDVLKFKDKPVIPIGLQGEYVTNSQGQFQILYNRLSKRCAIVFNIHQNVCFGFKCKAKKVSNEDFPTNESIYANDFFDVIIDTELLKVDKIKNEDLKIINTALEKTELEDVKNSLNDILIALKAKDKKSAKSSLDKFGKMILNGTSLTGNLTKIIDSYSQDGAPQQFVGKIIDYINL